MLYIITNIIVNRDVNYDCRTGGLRQHEASYGLSRGRLGRVRRRGRPIPGDHGGSGREGSASATVAVASAELPPGTSAVGRVLGGARGGVVHDVDVRRPRCQQLRAAAEHGPHRDAARSGNDAAASGRLEPVPGSVSSAAARETLSTLGRGTGVLTLNPRRTIEGSRF